MKMNYDVGGPRLIPYWLGTLILHFADFSTLSRPSLSRLQTRYRNYYPHIVVAKGSLRYLALRFIIDSFHYP